MKKYNKSNKHTYTEYHYSIENLLSCYDKHAYWILVVWLELFWHAFCLMRQLISFSINIHSAFLWRRY